MQPLVILLTHQQGTAIMLDNKFSVKDKVMADGPFWLTITEVRANGWYSCRFGSIGGDAGSYHERDLIPYTGV